MIPTAELQGPPHHSYAPDAMHDLRSDPLVFQSLFMGVLPSTIAMGWGLWANRIEPVDDEEWYDPRQA